MSTRPSIRLVRVGGYATEVDVQLIEDDPPGTGWGPYLSPEDAEKLDDIRRALRVGDLASAAKLGRVFRLEPITDGALTSAAE